MLPSVFGKPEMFAAVTRVYRARWEANGRDWEDARVGACSHTHVAPTSAEARRWETYYGHYWDFVGGLLEGTGIWPAFDFDELLAGPAVCGSPSQVLDRIGRWSELLDLDRHLFMFDLGGIDEKSLRSTMELFGSEVVPHLP
jgi:alkanesulfonate monooxygenase SsuD/methylene tetrahydromethanopterin reductase-like flavin-dependent oxidoreductase (luciferase family)